MDGGSGGGGTVNKKRGTFGEKNKERIRRTRYKKQYCTTDGDYYNYEAGLPGCKLIHPHQRLIIIMQEHSTKTYTGNQIGSSKAFNLPADAPPGALSSIKESP